MTEAEAEAAARLLERLLSDANYRERFRANPVAASLEAGLESVAKEMSLGQGKVFDTLDERESRSSLAGMFMAAALEGAAIFDFSQQAIPHLDDVPQAVENVLSRVHMPAIADAQAATPTAPGVEPLADPGLKAAAVASPNEAGQFPAVTADQVSAAGASAGVAASASSDHVDPSQYGQEGTGGDPSQATLDLLQNRNVSFDATGIADLKAGKIDPRIVSVLTAVAQDHKISVSAMVSDHDKYTSGGSVSNHYYGRAMDISVVDGQPVSPSNGAARELAIALSSLPASIRPSEIGSPWSLAGAAYFTDGAHQNHVHVAFDDPIASSWSAPGEVAGSDGAAAGSDGASADAVAPAAPAVMPAVTPASSDGSDGGAEPGGLEDPGGDTNAEADAESDGGGDGDDNDSVSDDPSDEQENDEGSGDDGSDSGDGEDSGVDGDHDDSSDSGSEDTSDSDGSDGGEDSGSSDSGSSDGGSAGGADPSGAVDLSGASGTYPGDNAPKAQMAAWMGAEAQKRGLPPELPVMASLVESGMQNLSGGDADSVGFFQMRVGIWNQGDYAGYPDNAELQLKWFLDQAAAVKSQRVAAGKSVTDPGSYGDWIADVERPAAQYRGRYQLQLGEAQSLLKQGANSKGGGDGSGGGSGLELVDNGSGGSSAGRRATAAVAEAKKYLGTPYQWGGSSPKTGFDCSGLTQWAYAKAGIQIPRTSEQQILASNGKPVDRGHLLPGDLVFFRNSSGDVHHVGISLGGDKFISAPHTGDVVKVASLKESYYAQEFAGGRRFDGAVGKVVQAAGAQAAAAQPAAEVQAADVQAAEAALARDAAEVQKPGTLLFEAVQAQEARKADELQVLRAVNPSA